MALAQINQKEYLKKYLSSGEKKKKKKKIIKSHEPRIKVVDDDIDLKNIKMKNDTLDFSQFGDEAPLVVAIVDNRPLTVKIQEELNGPKWKTVGEGPETSKSKSSDVQKNKIKRERKDDSDTSPPRKKAAESDASSNRNSPDESPPRRNRKNINDSDKSPVRKVKKRHNSDSSPPRRQKKNYDSDVSPPRGNKNYDSDVSPPRKSKRESSPTRKNKKDNNSNLTPPRRQNKNYDSDASPPRRQTKNYDSDMSPPRKFQREDSPSRIQKKRNYDSDVSPPRRRERAKEDSPSIRFSRGNKSNALWRKPRGQSPYKNNYFRNQSPFKNKYSRHHSNSPDRRKKFDSDHLSSKKRYSPPNNSRYVKHYERDSPRRSTKHHSSPPKEKSYSHSGKISNQDRYRKTHSDKPDRTMEGRKAGLQNAEDLRKECEEIKRREQEMFAHMKEEHSGRSATTIVRDRKTGRVRDFEQEAKEHTDKKKKEDVHKEKYSRWGKGLKQVQEQEERVESAIKEMAKPLARYADDVDLDDHLKSQLREGDPLLDYMKKKRKEKDKNNEDPLTGKTTNKPKYDGAYPANRFNIAPGYRWDGVDRSNGFEKKWFEQINSKKASEEEAYKWSTSDM